VASLCSVNVYSLACRWSNSSGPWPHFGLHGALFRMVHRPRQGSHHVLESLGPRVGFIKPELMSCAFHCMASQHGPAPRLTGQHWHQMPDLKAAATCRPEYAGPSSAWPVDQVTRAAELARLIEQLPRHVLGNGGCAPFGETDGGHGGHEIS